jgi:hypothetical protein
MPAGSIALRRLAGLAEHHPEKVSKKNRSILKMTGVQLHDFASTPETGLPYKKGKKRKSKK